MVMFSMNIQVFAGRKCLKTSKTLHAIPVSVKVKETRDGFQSPLAKVFCVNINPVVIHQGVTMKPISFRTNQKASPFKFFHPQHYSNPPFAPPRTVFID